MRPYFYFPIRTAIMAILSFLWMGHITEVQAQPEPSLSFSWGLLSTFFMEENGHVDSEVDENGKVISNVTQDAKHPPVTLNLRYGYRLWKRVEFGVGLGIEQIRMDQSTTTFDWEGDELISRRTLIDDQTFKARNLFLLFNAKAYWLLKRHVSMGSRIGAGYQFRAKRSYNGDSPKPVSVDKYHRFGLHVSLVCLEVGNEHWRGFGELGVGLEGTVQLGIKYIFPSIDKEED